MINKNSFFRQGIERIKLTKKYAQEKNVPNWYAQIFAAVVIIFISSSILTLGGILMIFSSHIDTHNMIFISIGKTIQYYPIILTFFFMIRYGQYPIKLMILLSSYFQNLFMKGINKLDMYLWKKTGKDSMASSFLIKHGKIIQLLLWVSLIINFIYNNMPK